MHIIYTELNYELPEKYRVSQISSLNKSLLSFCHVLTTVSVAEDIVRNEIPLLTELMFGIGRQMVDNLVMVMRAMKKKKTEQSHSQLSNRLLA